jgi:hypothetical protein
VTVRVAPVPAMLTEEARKIAGSLEPNVKELG